MKYIIVDWMYNICIDSYNLAYDHIDDASEYLDRMVEQELAEDGLYPYGYPDDELEEGFTAHATDEDFEEYWGEYSIEEYNESTDRIMWTGTRYVLKKDYYKAIA